MITGRAHWKLLLQMRALDNQMYVAGASPARNESADFVAWAHSQIVNPWWVTWVPSKYGMRVTQTFLQG